MTISVVPKTTSAISDNPTEVAAGKIPPSVWNTGHKILQATLRLLGRTSVGDGETEEISIGAGLTLGSTTLGLDKASVANIRASVADKVITADGVENACAIVTLTDATTVAIDWDAFLMADVTFTANRTLGNPTNVQVGTTRYIVVKGSSTTPRTISFGSNFKGDLPTNTVTTTAWLLIGLTALTTTHIIVSSCKAL